MRGILKKLARRHRHQAVTWFDGPLPAGPVRFSPAAVRAGDVLSPRSEVFSPPAVDHPPAA